MASPELVEYIKQSLAAGQAQAAIRQTLVTQGWAEAAVDEAFATLLPAVPKPPRPVPVPPAPAPTAQATTSLTPAELHYTSPLSLLLAMLLFVALLLFTGQLLRDINNVFAPYSPNRLEETAAYQKLKDAGHVLTSETASYQQLSQQYQAHHKSDQVKSLLVTAVVTVAFSVAAFLVHSMVQDHRRQYLALSVPYYAVSALYILSLIFQVMGLLFADDSVYAIYLTLLILIVVATVGVVVYQRRSHKTASAV